MLRPSSSSLIGIGAGAATEGGKISRRALLERLGLLALLGPQLQLGRMVARFDAQHRRRRALAELGNLWIGHF